MPQRLTAQVGVTLLLKYRRQARIEKFSPFLLTRAVRNQFTLEKSDRLLWPVADKRNVAQRRGYNVP